MNRYRFFARISTGLLAVVLLAGVAQAAPLTWLTDLTRAQTQATKKHKSVLLFFHGSDWCPTCLEMQQQVFDTPGFADYAGKMLVLMDVDFPGKTAQSEELKQANLALKARFNLSHVPNESLPTIVLLNESGETLFQETGYDGGGLPEVLPKLQHHTGLGEPAAANAPFKDLSVDEFAQMAGDKQNVILDVRTAKEFSACDLPGAVNLDVSATDFKSRAAAFDPSKVYLVHCASGVRSVRACDQLVTLGFPKLYNLPGGFRAWVKAGKPVEQ